MNRILSLMAMAFMLLGVFSCQKYNNPEGPVEYEQVTFSVASPDAVATKSIASGNSATVLDFAVYYNGNYVSTINPNQNASVTEGVDENENVTWEVVLTLVKNVSYDVVFWAHADNDVYEFDMEKATITVKDKYAGNANDDSRDAFYHCVTDYVASSVATDVYLTRPFAQINFASSDYDPYITDFDFDVDSRIACDSNDGAASLSVPTVLNVLDGSVDEYVDLEFASTAVPYEGGDKVLVELDGVVYHWMAMNYILAPETKSTIDKVTATFTYNGCDLPVEVLNVPFRRNYKTNILGAFFSGSTEFNIQILPGFAGTYSGSVEGGFDNN